MTRPVLLGAAILGTLTGLLAALVPACSGENQEGPLVTCADLQCGRINACQEGIIAQCSDGVTVRYHACSSEKTLCEAEWQVPGQYRCEAAMTACEGCNPDSVGCATGGEGGAAGAAPSVGGGGAGATGATGGTSAGGTGGVGG
jgi:hypothetical protein